MALHLLHKHRQCNINKLSLNKLFHNGTSNMRHITRASTDYTVEDLKNNNSSVADFYNGKSIFITGGTGFLGKMYIRNLLHTCPDIGKIYTLIRPSSKETGKCRLEKTIRNSKSLFQGLNEELFKKLVPIDGDLTAPNLGIHPDDIKLLQEEVSIIVHSAASIDVNATLRDAIDINVTGTNNLLAIAKRVQNLQAFLHVSTFYCAMSADKKPIEERMYPPPIDPNDIPKILEKYGHMRFPPKSLLRDKQNTYIFTKAISEYIVHSTHGDIPTAIIRPSLIGSSNSEPYKGWIDVLNIHSFILTAISNGLTRILNIDKNTVWDFIPVDYVANLMILAATKCKRSNEVDIYNCASSGINPVKISKATSIFISDFVNNKCNTLPFPFLLYLKSKPLFTLLDPVLHTTPAFINDLRLTMTGKKANSVKYLKKLSAVSEEIRFLGGHSWQAKSDQVTSLVNSLNDDDRKKFPCDPSDINWIEYFNKYSEGIRNLISKDIKQRV